ncbi:MAG: hypothetical protein ACRELC_03885 [Gemmatimonadota bacterium]
MSLPARTLWDGIVAGLLAGVVLAVLFYFYDLGQGAPLRTPAFLWGALTGQAEIEPTTGVIVAFTIVHFIVWAALGVLAALLIEWGGLPRNFLIGAAYGLFACSVVFYLGLIRAPDDIVLSAPGWPAVFFGNTLAGVVMFTHLHWSSTEPGVIGMLAFLQAHRTTRQGITAGLVGAITVALWFLLIDSMLREPLFTPAALGTILFRGGGGPQDVVIAAGPVVGYTLVHVAFFVLFGVILSGLTDQVERFPPLIFGLVILFVVFEVFFVAGVAILGRWVLEELAWWSVLIGNVLAAATMTFYMWKVHPALAGQLKSEVLWAE